MPLLGCRNGPLIAAQVVCCNPSGPELGCKAAAHQHVEGEIVEHIHETGWPRFEKWSSSQKLICWWTNMMSTPELYGCSCTKSWRLIPYELSRQPSQLQLSACGSLTLAGMDVSASGKASCRGHWMGHCYELQVQDGSDMAWLGVVSETCARICRPST